MVGSQVYMSGSALSDSLWFRFQQVPTFGQDTIWKFSGNVSALKKLAGQDFEDIMQVSAHHYCQGHSAT